ncbi:MAG: elongation factor-1 alpha [Proteobacteria bacterium]|nr:elongation factor-1 alpha [Pseudomonadota bacterium]
MSVPPRRFVLNLPSLSVSLRVLFTGFLVVIGLGIAMSGVQVLLTHGMADGKLGVSRDDIVFSYYGNRSDSRMAAKLAGTMKDKASTADKARIIRWIESDSPPQEWTSEVQAVFAANCVHCHGTIPGLADFRTYEGVTAYTEIDKGVTIDALTRVSHIHLFGIAFISFFVCIIFSMSVGLPTWLKATAIGLPFLFQLVDITSWWLTKWYPGFAYGTLVCGFSYSISSAFMILTSLYQMWVMPWRGRTSLENTWTELPPVGGGG